MLDDRNLFCCVLRDAQETRTAIAAINIFNYHTARAVIHAAQKAYRPVILQPSTGIVKYYGVEEVAAMVHVLRAKANVPIVLHLDHCTDEELARACIRAGWDSVMVDFSARPMEENITYTRRIADYAHIYGVAVEGEIGVIAGVEDSIVHETAYPATFQDTVSYLERAHIDAVAPAIGTAHGLYTGRPKIDFDLVRQLGTKYVPVVIHGGTGLLEEDFVKLIRCGAAKINISTALKQRYLDTCRSAIASESAPLAFDRQVETACFYLAQTFIRLFAGEEVKLCDSKLSSRPT